MFRGQKQRLLVENAHETRGVTARAHVAGAFGVAGGQADEWRALDELTRQLVEAIRDLADHDRLRRSDQGT
jgi:hypothetical protein